ncbi:MAG TPA: ABC transporter ATP-binding protein [Candidatus Thermoplasmatota archaeon]|nr:ABC transporter ATP-binding protein [Candidatus Thermoplasmatota archaeon]
MSSRPSMRVQGLRRNTLLVGLALAGSLLDATAVVAIFLFGLAIAQHAGQGGTVDRLTDAVDTVAASLGMDTVALLAVTVVLATLLRGIGKLAIEFVLVQQQMRTQTDLARRLFQGYFGLRYETFLERNNSERFTTILVDVDRAALSFVSFLRLVVDGTSIAVLLAVLTVIDWHASLFILATGAVLLVALRPLWHRSQALGEARNLASRNVAWALWDPLKSYRAVVAFGATERFGDQLDQRYRRYAGLVRRYAVYNAMIAPALELGVAAMVLVGAVVLPHMVGNDTAVLPFFLLVVSNAYRLLPALSSLSSNYHAYRFSRASWGQVHGELQQIAQDRESTPTPNPHEPGLPSLVEMQGISFHYREGPEVLQGVNLAIAPGERIGIQGASGGGKSTLVDLLLGLLHPTQGALRLGGGRPGHRPRLAYLPQDAYLLDGSLLDNIAISEGAAKADRAKAEQLLDMVGLGRSAIHPLGLDDRIGEGGVRLSGGQRQRLGLARALYHNPDLLILDEPTASLDREAEDQLIEALSRIPNLAMVLVTHREAPLRICRRVLRLEQGRLVEGR